MYLSMLECMYQKRIPEIRKCQISENKRINYDKISPQSQLFPLVINP